MGPACRTTTPGTDVTELIWIATTLLALLAGGGVGVWFGRRGPVRALEEQTRQAQKDLQDQQARAADSLRAVQAKAAKDLEDARVRWQAEAAVATAAQRAETEKLTRHLSEACDELDRLRAAGPAQAPDTGQGFAATMPLGDL
jgi:hypothetical protein